MVQIEDKLTLAQNSEALEIFCSGVGEFRRNYWNDDSSYALVAIYEGEVIGAGLAKYLDASDRI